MLNEPNIIFEDENIIVLYKPEGYLSHPVKKGDLRPSITEWLAQKYPNLREVGKSENRFSIIHRLDLETSGIILAAKNQKIFDALQKQFKEKLVKKEYIAIVEGNIEKSGVINAPLTFSRSKKNFKIKIVDRNVKKKQKVREAKTAFNILKKFKEYTLIKVIPLTGRTHQIRVHLKSIKHPIIGDSRYNKKSKASRLFLHASAIEFSYFEGKRVRFESALPTDFKDFLKM